MHLGAADAVAQRRLRPLACAGQHADVVLPGSLHEEDEGTVATLEGRVVKINEAVPPPGEARRDWEIVCDLARRLDLTGTPPGLDR